MPEFLKEMLENQYGKEIANEILEGYSQKRKVTLRVNTIKTTVSEVCEKLESENIKFEKVKWSDEALIIENATEKDIEKLEIYINGEIYMQNLSSMLPPIILDPKEGEDILDMAAAPGGKTTQIAALTNNKSNITACENNHIRAERLKYNIKKQGATSVYVMEADSRNLDDFFSFDRILLDAPCSGSGTLEAENENLEKYFTKKLIEKSIKTQTALLGKALKLLKPGKEMIYSTCSVLECENEDIIRKFVDGKKYEIVPIEIEGEENLPKLKSSIKGTMAIAPTEYYEGFFVAKIKKN